jgi:hypothetical protein
MYGYATQYPQAQAYGTYAMQPPQTGGASVFGAEPGALDKLKAFMDKETAGVKNKYLVGGALALGVGYYGYTKGWF